MAAFFPDVSYDRSLPGAAALIHAGIVNAPAYGHNARAVLLGDPLSRQITVALNTAEYERGVRKRRGVQLAAGGRLMKRLSCLLECQAMLRVLRCLQDHPAWIVGEALQFS